MESTTPGLKDIKDLLSLDLSTVNVDSLMKQLLLQNPHLLDMELKKLSPGLTVEKKEKQHTRPKNSSDRILLTKSLCLLCGFIELSYHRLTWDSLQGAYRANKIPPNLPDVLHNEIRLVETLTCRHCVAVLQEQSKEDLIKLLKNQTDPIKCEFRESGLRKMLRKGESK